MVGIGRVIAIASTSNEAYPQPLGAAHFIATYFVATYVVATNVMDRHRSTKGIDEEVRALLDDDLTMIHDWGWWCE